MSLTASTGAVLRSEMAGQLRQRIHTGMLKEATPGGGDRNSQRSTSLGGLPPGKELCGSGIGLRHSTSSTALTLLSLCGNRDTSESAKSDKAIKPPRHSFQGALERAKTAPPGSGEDGFLNLLRSVSSDGLPPAAGAAAPSRRRRSHGISGRLGVTFAPGTDSPDGVDSSPFVSEALRLHRSFSAPRRQCGMMRTASTDGLLLPPGDYELPAVQDVAGGSALGSVPPHLAFGGGKSVDLEEVSARLQSTDELMSRGDKMDRLRSRPLSPTDLDSGLSSQRSTLTDDALLPAALAAAAEIAQVQSPTRDQAPRRVHFAPDCPRTPTSLVSTRCGPYNLPATPGAPRKAQRPRAFHSDRQITPIPFNLDRQVSSFNMSKATCMMSSA